MLPFHYQDYVLIDVRGSLYPLQSIYRDCKTRTLTNPDGFKLKINVPEGIKISPKTFWRVSGHYDHQFDGHDANCYLCNWYGMDYDKCKCKKHFTIEEYPEIVVKARKNFLKSVLSNYPKIFKIEGFNLTKKFIDEMDVPTLEYVMYGTSEYGGHMVNFTFPSVYHTSQSDDIKFMNDRWVEIYNKYLK